MDFPACHDSRMNFLWDCEVPMPSKRPRQVMTNNSLLKMTMTIIIYSGFTHWKWWIFHSFLYVNVYSRGYPDHPWSIRVPRSSQETLLDSVERQATWGFCCRPGPEPQKLWVIFSSQKRPQIAEIQWNPITKNHKMFMEAPKEWAANHHHWHFWAEDGLLIYPHLGDGLAASRTFWFAWIPPKWSQKYPKMLIPFVNPLLNGGLRRVFHMSGKILHSWDGTSQRHTAPWTSWKPLDHGCFFASLSSLQDHRLCTAWFIFLHRQSSLPRYRDRDRGVPTRRDWSWCLRGCWEVTGDHILSFHDQQTKWGLNQKEATHCVLEV